jgi:DNA polymerase-1
LHKGLKVKDLEERWGMKRTWVAETRVREVYVPEAGHSFVYFDISQAEMRFAAYLSGDPKFIETCRGDIHTGNARIIFPDEKSLVDDPKGAGKAYRDIAKSAGFAVCYGAEAETVFERLRAAGFPVKLSNVTAMLDRIKASYSEYYRWVNKNIEFVNKHGYMRTALTGRIRWLGWHCKPNEIMNYPIQSAVADIMNLRMTELVPKMPARLVAQVHDACIFEVRDEDVETVKAMLWQAWDEPVVLPTNGASLVLPIDLKVGKRWAEYGEDGLKEVKRAKVA